MSIFVVGCLPNPFIPSLLLGLLQDATSLNDLTTKFETDDRESRLRNKSSNPMRGQTLLQIPVGNPPVPWSGYHQGVSLQKVKGRAHSQKKIGMETERSDREVRELGSF
jgi:hypothetical protein